MSILVTLLAEIFLPSFLDEVVERCLLWTTIDPSQTSAMAMKAVKDQGAQLFGIPARSPDLNPIENVFHIVKSNLDMQVRTQGITHGTSE